MAAAMQQVLQNASALRLRVQYLIDGGVFYAHGVVCEAHREAITCTPLGCRPVTITHHVMPGWKILGMLSRKDNKTGSVYRQDSGIVYMKAADVPWLPCGF